MSATSIEQNNFYNLRRKMDELMVCVAEKDLLFRKMGVINNTKDKDLDLFLYLDSALTNRFCEGLIEDPCFLDKLNSLYLKFV